MRSIDNMWDGFENAEIYDRGAHLKPGFSGVVEILRTLAKATREKGLAFIVEFKILESNLDDHPVDSKGSWYVNMMKDSAHSNTAGWAAACAGLFPSQKEEIKKSMQIFKDMIVEATRSPDNNAFVGERLRLVTRLVKTKTGGDFTIYDWSPLAA